MPATRSHTATRLRVSPRVADPAELEARIRELLAQVDTGSIDFDPPGRRTGPHPYVDAAQRAERLHQLWGTIVQPGVPAAQGVRGKARRLVKRATHKATRWYVEQRWDAQHELDAEIARFATDAVLATRRSYLELRDAREEIDALRRELDAQRQDLTRLRSDSATLSARCDVLATALEEVPRMAARSRQLERVIVERASASEVQQLREQTAQLMQRLGVASAHGADFDYVAFEDRFRGDSTALAERQADYVTKFPGSDETGMIVDVGCGRGEMLGVLRDAGHEVLGIDLDANMVEVCRAKGLPVIHGDGTAWLETCTPDTLKGIFSAQVIEHLLTGEIERFVRASLAALRHGGVLVMETINPRSLHALANHFFADVSHVRPVHPETLRFMCEQAGFAEVALMELSPHPALDAAGRLGHEPVDDAVRELISSVFGFQDYAIVARKLNA